MSSLSNKSLVSIEDLSKEDILSILDFANQIKQKERKVDYLQDKIVASCFFEPSTRTRLSFESSALRLGMKVLGFSDVKSSSHTKGESLTDAMRMMEAYADLIVLRHPNEGAARLVADTVKIPVINAGDGANQHPTQALLDLFTIRECVDTNQEIHIAFMGDLLHGRTVHSLARACNIFNCRLYFVSSKELALPSYLTENLKRNAVRFSFHENVAEVIDKVDILYMTRLQQERKAASLKAKKYSISLLDLVHAKSTLKILHPLPRVDEIELAIDKTPHAYYFQQAHNGLYVRQALLAMLLNSSGEVE